MTAAPTRPRLVETLAGPRQLHDAEAILHAVRQTDLYVTRREFRGYDPYDALRSPLFALPLLRSSKVLRLGALQIVKRLPVNIRPLLRIDKGLNPVTLGLMIQGYAYLSDADPQRADYYRSQILACLNDLDQLRSPGYSGDCWGYDFDWEARYGRLPAYTPTIVATGFITNALFTAYELVGLERAFEVCRSACRFVMHDLPRTFAPDGTFCWSYSPLETNVVLNATMKGARLCAQVHSVEASDELYDAAARTAHFVASHQQETGAWPYAIGDARSWVDNFHTGYVLDCFDEYERRTGDHQFASKKERGWAYYRRSLFAYDHIPKYYDHKLYPVDTTACAQSILTLTRFGDIATALRLADWTLRNMGRGDGSFAYRMYSRYTNRIPYMRWSVAWMFCALSRLLHEISRSGMELEQP